MKNPGLYIKLADGRKGYIYKKELLGSDPNIVLKLVDDNFKPRLKDGKPLVALMKKQTKFEVIGFID